MATFNPDIFRAYDVRGEFPDDFDAAFAQQLGGRVVAHLKAETLVVGRDARMSSDELAYAVIDGAVHAGTKVIDVGVLSTPQFYWTIRSSGAAGGVMVTASHNPPKYNGFKVVAAHGPLLEVLGGHTIRQIYDSRDTAHRASGEIEYRDVAADYAAAVAYAAGWQGGRELLMAVDGPEAVRDVLSRLGPIAPDHGLAVRYDPDGDRVAFFENGEQIPADFIFLLLAEQLHLSPVVFDLRFSRTVRNRLAAHQIPYTVSKVGRLFLTEAMHRTHAALGGELSGHYYWREFGGMESPELTTLRLYEIIQKSGRALSELVAPYRILSKSAELAVPLHDLKHAGAVIEKLKKHFRHGRQDMTDGLTVEFSEWWFNIRPSNTEPLLRLVVEAEKKDLLDRMVAEVLGVVTDSAVS